MAGAAEAGVDLVEDENEAALVTELAQSGKEACGGHHDAATPLNRLDDDRADRDVRALEEPRDGLESGSSELFVAG